MYDEDKTNEANRLIRSGDLIMAARYIEKMIENDHSSELYTASARCYFLHAQGNSNGEGFEDAVRILIRAIKDYPNDANIHAQLATYLSLGTLDYVMAAEECRIALNLNPCNLSALLSGSYLYGVPDNVVSLDEAIQWTERILELNPIDTQALHVRLSYLYKESHQHEKASRERVKSLLLGADSII